MTQPGWRALLTLEAALVELRRDVAAESAMTDYLAADLELRVAQLEEVLYARWPRRILVRRRLRRDLRQSVAHVQGRTWTDRRAETIGTGWTERRP